MFIDSKEFFRQSKPKSCRQHIHPVKDFCDDDGKQFEPNLDNKFLEVLKTYKCKIQQENSMGGYSASPPKATVCSIFFSEQIITRTSAPKEAA